VVDVAGDPEGLGVAGYHVDDSAQDFGLAAGCPAWSGGPAVLGDHQREVTEAGRGQVVVAVGLQQTLNNGGQAAGRDGAEHVGEEVKADVVQVGDELLAARPGETGKKCAVRAEQR
jgi:hypothetical protein